MQHVKNCWLQLVLVLTLFSPVALSHEGHDHNHWSSMFIHALFLLSNAAVGLACMFAIYKALGRFQSTGE